MVVYMEAQEKKTSMLENKGVIMGELKMNLQKMKK